MLHCIHLNQKRGCVFQAPRRRASFLRLMDVRRQPGHYPVYYPLDGHYGIRIGSFWGPQWKRWTDTLNILDSWASPLWPEGWRLSWNEREYIFRGPGHFGNLDKPAAKIVLWTVLRHDYLRTLRRIRSDPWGQRGSCAMAFTRSKEKGTATAWSLLPLHVFRQIVIKIPF